MHATRRNPFSAVGLCAWVCVLGVSILSGAIKPTVWVVIAFFVLAVLYSLGAGWVAVSWFKASPNEKVSAWKVLAMMSIIFFVPVVLAWLILSRNG